MEKVTQLHALYSSPDIIRNIKSRRLRWAGHVARMGESRNAYRVLVGRPEGKRPSGKPRRRWEDNIKMDLREVEYDDRDWINLAQHRDRWQAYVRPGNEPPGSLKASRPNIQTIHQCSRYWLLPDINPGDIGCGQTLTQQILVVARHNPVDIGCGQTLIQQILVVARY
ncbi:hypothetical protein ANN_00667 [Periplaneta americana]|uniref:Uncharacterized protein n=1 Tax=Periplaneta americana TaxID=6978 RepID=A0ABQ8TUN5_PERAM|nr:hypothetical protein ANN_00667 [Periplaneta americana]